MGSAEWFRFKGTRSIVCAISVYLLSCLLSILVKAFIYCHFVAGIYVCKHSVTCLGFSAITTYEDKKTLRVKNLRVTVIVYL